MRQHQSDQGVAALQSTWSTVVKIATEPAPLAGAPAEEQVVGPNPASDHIANPSRDVVDHWSRSPLGSRTDFTLGQTTASGPITEPSISAQTLDSLDSGVLGGHGSLRVHSGVVKTQLEPTALSVELMLLPAVCTLEPWRCSPKRRGRPRSVLRPLLVACTCRVIRDCELTFWLYTGQIVCKMPSKYILGI
jgi:hypothetical protein